MKFYKYYLLISMKFSFYIHFKLDMKMLLSSYHNNE